MSKRPSPALIVSAIALTFALVGTAVAADPVAKLNAKKVKKIARQEISNAAPTLSVRDAKTAEASTTAVTATNALALGGKALAAIQVRSAGFQDVSVQNNLPAAFTNVVAGTITTVVPGQVLANGSVELDGDGTDASIGTCRMVIAGTGSANYETTFDDIGTDNPATVAVSFARTLPAGTHAVSLQCQGTQAGTLVDKDDAELNVIGVPTP